MEKTDRAWRHDLRNCINGISLTVRVLELTPVTDVEGWIESVDAIIESADECIAMIDATIPGDASSS